MTFLVVVDAFNDVSRCLEGSATMTDQFVGLVPAVDIFPTHQDGAVRVVRHVLTDTAQSALVPTPGNDELSPMLSGRLYDCLPRPVPAHGQHVALDLSVFEEKAHLFLVFLRHRHCLFRFLFVTF